MNTLKINRDLVTHIKIFNEKKDFYVWLHKKNLFFGTLCIYREGFYREGIYREGIYRDFWGHHTLEDLEELYCNNLVFKNKSVSLKPHIEIYCQKTLLKILYFDSLEEAKKYCNNYFPKINFEL